MHKEGIFIKELTPKLTEKEMETFLSEYQKAALIFLKKEGLLDELQFRQCGEELEQKARPV